jgi:hypothetical protein
MSSMAQWIRHLTADHMIIGSNPFHAVTFLETIFSNLLPQHYMKIVLKKKFHYKRSLRTKLTPL